MPMTVRQSMPPGAPPPFQETRIPDNIKDPQFVGRASSQRESLEFEHARLKPDDFKSNVPPFVPPMAPPRFAAEDPKNISPWPQYRYHRTKAPEGVIVRSEEHEKIVCTGQGWQEIPFPKEVAKLETRLELLDSIIETLAVVAEGEETPMQVLERIINERDEFARKLAMKAKEK